MSRLGRLVRVSSDGQERRELSLPEQRRLTESACLKYGYPESPLFDEHATSTSLPLGQRPILTQLRLAIESGQLAGLCLVRLDRLARPVGTEGLREAAEILEWLVASRCLILCSGLSRDLSDAALYDMKSANDLRRVRDELLKSGDEKQLMKERMATGIRRIEEQGKWRGGQLPWWYTYEASYRTKKPKPVVDPVRAEVVRFIYQQFLLTPNYARVVEALNQHPIYASMRNQEGEEWTRLNVFNLLRSPRAAGLEQYGAQGKREEPSAIIKSATWEAVIDLSTWNAVQQIREARKPNQKMTVRRHPLTAILRCETCGGPMWHRPRPDKKHGKVWSSSYFCKNKGCAYQQAISSKLAHQVALGYAIKILTAYRERPKILDPSLAEKMAHLEQELLALDTVQSRLTWALVNAGLPESEFTAQQASVNARRQAISKELSSVKADNLLGNDPIDEIANTLDAESAPLDQIFLIYESIILTRVSYMNYQPSQIILMGGQPYPVGI